MVGSRVCVFVVVVGSFVGCGPAIPEGVKDLRINEVAAEGRPVDWVELTNIGDADIALDDVALTDSTDELARGSFEEGAVVAPGEFVVVAIDEAGVGFGLGADEEFFVVARDGDLIIDRVDWNDGDSKEGGSYARVADGVGEFAAVDVDTRGRSNG
jgi:hypothetical protein